MAGIDNKISNIIGSRIPDWVMHQLVMRSVQNSLSSRDSENITYLANKTAWVRLVSSVDIKPDANPHKYGSGDQNVVSSTLAKQNVLFGGLSEFSKDGYKFRSGFEETYNVNGNESIEKYGYRPMPGITSAKIETQGKLGSVRSATIEFKVWTKDQLDIMDALYFKLGFSMFLEWGHVKYYRTSAVGNKPLESYQPVKEGSSQFYSIDPFDSGEDKDSIRLKIANNVRASNGNYDAMLGIVTNFNFSMNQDGGYDCSVKLMSLGILADSMRVNSIGSSPKVLEADIRYLVDRINEQNETKAQREKAIQDANDPGKYPPCVSKLGSPKTTIAGSLDLMAIFANVNGVQYYFYRDGRYETTGHGKKGTYECKGDALYIDGKSVDDNKKTYAQWIRDYEKEGVVNLKSIPSIIDSTTKIKYDSYFPTKHIVGISKFNAIIDINLGNLGDITANLDLDAILPKKTGTTNLPGLPNAFGQSTESTIDVYSGGVSSLDQIARKSTSLAQYLVDVDTSNRIKLTAIDRSAATDSYSEGKLYATYIDKSDLDALRIEDKGSIWGIFRLNNNRVVELNYNTFDKNKKIIQEHSLQLVIPIEGKITVNKRKDGNTYVVEKPKASFIGLYEGDDVRRPIFPLIKQYIVNQLSKKDVEYRYEGLLEDAKMDGAAHIFSTSITVPLKADVVRIEAKGATGESRGNEVISNEGVNVTFPIFIVTNDSSIITNLNVPPRKISRVLDYVGNQQDISDQDQQQITETEDPNNLALDLDVAEVIKETAQKYKSNLECILRAIQVHSLIKYRDDNRVVKVNYITAPKSADTNQNISTAPVSKTDSDFMKSLLSSGLLTYELIEKAMSSKEESNTDGLVSSNKSKYDELMPYYVKYGFNHAALANKTTFKELANQKAAVDYPSLMTSYVIPYKQNQDLFRGASLNYPVYVPMGFFVMLLNHCGLLYEYDDAKSPTPKKKPLIYLDYNQHTNRCLTNDSMISTNPYRFVIPFEGSQEAYKKLFDPKVLLGDEIQGGQDFPAVKLFNFKEQDALSGWIPRFRYKTGDKREAYSGRIMDVLVSIDYVLQIVSAHTTKDETNGVYLKPLLEEMLSDMNKCFGNFNLFRLAYSDVGDCYYVSDDQLSPSLVGEDRIEQDVPNELPLFGLRSIADSLEIRTDISTKLGNMLAISANADVGSRSSSGLDAGSFNFGQYIDRFKPNVKDSTSPSASISDSDKSVAQQFNEAVTQFFSDTINSEDKVSGATNYYISRMVKLKNSDPGTRSSMMIPLSLNFSTDGITGLNMGQGFTVPNEILPYSYKVNKYGPEAPDKLNRVGFIVTGLDHSIESNRWKTNVKANMFYLKDMGDYNFNRLADQLSSTRVFTSTPEFYGGSTNEVTYNTDRGCSTSYSDLKELPSAEVNYLPLKTAAAYLKSKYPDIGPAVFAVMVAEAAKTEDGQSFRSAGGNNYGGVQTDSGRWNFSNFSAQFCRRDNGDSKRGIPGKLRMFAAFKSSNDFMDFLANRLRSKGFSASDGDTWVRTYIDKWWSPAEKSSYKKGTTVYNEKLSIYNSAIRKYNLS